MSQSDDIKSILSVRKVVEAYGFEVNRSGFIRCPFHSGDHDASLKVYDDHWYCFGCKCGGSVIDFAMKLFDISFSQACLRLNVDFGLGLSYERPDSRTKSLILQKRKEELRKIKELEDMCQKLSREYRECSHIAECSDPFSQEWADAVKRLPVLEYRIESLEDDLSKARKR